MVIDNFSFIENFHRPETLEGAIFYAVLFFILALLGSYLLRKSINRLISHTQRMSIDRTSVVFISQFLHVAIYLIAAIMYFHLIPALRAIGTAILATAGVGSIVIGLAAQNTLGNIISGISLLLYRQIRLGDKIKVYASAGNETGVVEVITMGYTTLSMTNQEKIIIPNSVLASTIIVNYGNRETEKEIKKQ